mgnify:CR=1 FL=1|tara:strand:- start:220 stop:516 length:297 start_codon:yes stop_codon:yes gene_type:complete
MSVSVVSIAPVPGPKLTAFDIYLTRKLTSAERKIMSAEEKRERKRAQSRVWYINNNDKALHVAAEYRKKNKEKLNQYQTQLRLIRKINNNKKNKIKTD